MGEDRPVTHTRHLYLPLEWYFIFLCGRCSIWVCMRRQAGVLSRGGGEFCIGFSHYVALHVPWSLWFARRVVRAGGRGFLEGESKVEVCIHRSEFHPSSAFPNMYCLFLVVNFPPSPPNPGVQEVDRGGQRGCGR